MTERYISDRLFGYFDHLYQLNNVFVFAWESDYFGVTKNTGYIYEVEVKLSVSDFRRDLVKTTKHLSLQNPDKKMISIPEGEVTKTEWIQEKLPCGRHKMVRDSKPAGYCHLHYIKNLTPNRFFYIVPKELKDKIRPDLPKYAGLLIIDNYTIRQVKQAPFLHRENIFKTVMPEILKKFYYKYQSQKVTIMDLRDSLNRKNHMLLEDGYEKEPKLF